MLHKNHITEAQLEALIDDELAPEERGPIESHVAVCAACKSALHNYKEEQALWSAAFQGRIDEATEAIDWGAFEARVMAQVADESFCEDAILATPTPCEPVAQPLLPAPKPSWQERLFGWIKSHPGLLIAAGATCGILLLFALPALDPGPSPKDVIVDRVIKNKAAKVSVLHSTNQATGRPITVIVIKEPPADPSQDNKPSKKAPSNRKP